MTPIIDANHYKELVTSLYQLILEEIKNPKDLEQQYPKFVVMYEFFRLLRGEAFIDLRELDHEFQKELYKMEDDLFNKVKELKESLPANSEKAKFHFDNLVSSGLKI